MKTYKILFQVNKDKYVSLRLKVKREFIASTKP